MRVKIDALVEMAERELERRMPDEAPSQRVRLRPSKRQVRSYTTLGILDPPLAWQGRTALYGIRHLLQLMAIKTLQFQGLSLEEIQGELLGSPSKKLRVLCRLPPGWEPSSSPAKPPAKAPPPSRDRFWERSPPRPKAPPKAVPSHQAYPLSNGFQMLIPSPLTPDSEALQDFLKDLEIQIQKHFSRKDSPDA